MSLVMVKRVWWPKFIYIHRCTVNGCCQRDLSYALLWWYKSQSFLLLGNHNWSLDIYIAGCMSTTNDNQYVTHFIYIGVLTASLYYELMASHDSTYCYLYGMYQVNPSYALVYFSIYNKSSESHDKCTYFMLCCVLLWLGIDWFYPYLSGFIHWQQGNHVIAPLTVQEPWRILMNKSNESLILPII